MMMSPLGFRASLATYPYRVISAKHQDPPAKIPILYPALRQIPRPDVDTPLSTTLGYDGMKKLCAPGHTRHRLGRVTPEASGRLSRDDPSRDDAFPLGGKIEPYFTLSLRRYR
jgi:hypothetical protein